MDRTKKFDALLELLDHLLTAGSFWVVYEGNFSLEASGLETALMDIDELIRRNSQQDPETLAAAEAQQAFTSGLVSGANEDISQGGQAKRIVWKALGGFSRKTRKDKGVSRRGKAASARQLAARVKSQDLAVLKAIDCEVHRGKPRNERNEERREMFLNRLVPNRRCPNCGKIKLKSRQWVIDEIAQAWAQCLSCFRNGELPVVKKRKTLPFSRKANAQLLEEAAIELGLMDEEEKALRERVRRYEST